jgi:four helix bundle protein
MGNFNKMEVWIESKALAVKIYQLTNRGRFSNDYSFRDQIRRSAISVPSNLAEGEESGSIKGSVRLFFIANASLAELRTQIEIAREVGYIRENEFLGLSEKMTLLSKRIMKLIQYRQSKL